MRLVVLSLLALAGCTTASDLRSRTPAATFSTSKPVPDVAQCLAESISSIGGPSIFQGSKETTITFVQKEATTLFISITPDGQGRVWRIHSLIPFKSALARCA
jgi:hypothetical protein